MDAIPTAAILRSRSAWWSLLAATAALLALLMLAAAAEAKNRPSCKPKGSKTVALTQGIRVYRTSRREGRGTTAQTVTRTYACRNRTRRRIRMSTLFSGPGNQVFGTEAYGIRLGGRFVAYGLRDVSNTRDKGGFPTPGDKVLRIDVTRGQARKTLTATPDETTLTDIALTERGAVAWITKNGVSPPASYVVALADAAGTRTLAAGTDIAPGSLAVSSSFVYWMRAGGAFARGITY